MSTDALRDVIWDAVGDDYFTYSVQQVTDNVLEAVRAWLLEPPSKAEREACANAARMVFTLSLDEQIASILAASRSVRAGEENEHE
jgi:hypothetical protein